MINEAAMTVDDAFALKTGAESRSTSAPSKRNNALGTSWAEQMGLTDSKELSTEMPAKDESLSYSREISLEFIEDVNEEKFERLLKEEKLKTPFKRRHSNSSNESRSNTSHSDNDVAQSEQNTKAKNCRTSKDEKRVRHNSQTSSSSSNSSYTEANPAILMRRQKQIDYGKNTIAYERYVELVPKTSRTRDHPRTPNKFGKYSRRAFDGLVKIWRKQLHHYDPPSDKQDESSSEDSDAE